MPVTPTGLISLPLTRLRTMLANVAAWQTWTGAIDATAALAFIDLIEDSTVSADKPRAVVDLGEEWSTRRASGTSPPFYSDRGTLALSIFAPVAAGNKASEADSLLDFTNNVGAVVEGLWALADQAGYLRLIEVGFTQHPSRARREWQREDVDTVDGYHCILRVQWGMVA